MILTELTAVRKLEPEGYTSYDLALDNRDAWQVISIKMQRIIISQYLNMQVEASASIRTKNGAAPTAELYHRETRSISVQDVKEFCKKHGITENVFFISAFGITLGKYNFKKGCCIYHYLPWKKRFQTFGNSGYAGKNTPCFL